MKIEDTKETAEAGSVRELNAYLAKGWVLIMSYVRHASDSQTPRFVVGWQKDDAAEKPEFLDEWELSEMDKQRYR